MDKYNYAILKSAATEKMNGAPVVNERGQIIGIFNAGGTSQSATDANYAKDFVVKGLSQNDVALRQSNIRVGLPNSLEESVVALMLSSEKPVGTHEALINDFIAKFPQANEGYYAKANLLVAQNDLVNADKVLQEEVNKATSKDEAHMANTVKPYLY